MALFKNGHEPDAKDTHGRTPLSYAAQSGREAEVKLLLAKDSVDPNSEDFELGWTPLSYAADSGHETVVKLLLATGAVDPDFKDPGGRTPLSHAAQNGHETVVKLLLATDGVDPNSEDSWGWTPLSQAAGHGHEAVVKLLLATDGVKPEPKDLYQKWTPLLHAARMGHEAVVKLLLATDGVNPDFKDPEYGRTPLSNAARNGHKEVVKLLLSNDGVDPNSKDKYGWTPLSDAIEYGHEEVVKLLLATESVDSDFKGLFGRTPLSHAAADGHEAVVKLLLAKDGVDPDSKSEYGQTPLSYAAGNGHEAVVKLLLATDSVDPDSNASYDGRTPLSYAAENGHEAVVKLFLSKDAVNPDSKDPKFGQTPLSWAARNGHEAVVKLLLAKDGVEPNSKSCNGQTPLSWAARSGHEAVVKLLLATGGVDLDSKDIHSQTPLSWAARNCNEEVVRLLLSKNAINPNSKDIYGYTPLLWAIRYEDEGEDGIEDEGWNNGGDEDGDEDVDEDGDEDLDEGEWEDEDGDEDGDADKNRDGPKYREEVIVRVVKLLLAADNVDPNSKDDNGQTPLSWAAEKGYEAVVKLLLAKAGVDTNSEDEDGQAPLWRATENDYQNVVETFTGSTENAPSLCRMCKEIPFHQLPFEDEPGYQHKLWNDLLWSQTTCDMCGIIIHCVGLRTERVRAIQREYPDMPYLWNGTWITGEVPDIAGNIPTWLYGNWWIGRNGEVNQLTGIGARVGFGPEAGKASGTGKNVIRLLGSFVRVLTDLDDPMAALIPGRLREIDSSSVNAFDTVRTWLDSCDKLHDCVPKKEAALPTRVLDLHHSGGLTVVSLVEGRGRSGKYIALSHCWGSTHTITTTKLTLEQRKQAISLADLPKTYRDAVLIARQLNIRWLWIDSLCIVQDDDFEWRCEASKMADTYAGAYLTIAASSSKNDSSGCFPQRVNTKYTPPDYKGYHPIERDPTHIVIVSTSFHGRQSRLYMLPEWMESSSKKKPKKYEIGAVNLSYDPAEEEHLASRAWTLQERLMSPRVIHYGADQIFWECLQEYVSEDGARFPSTYLKLSELINGEVTSPSTRHLTGWPLLIESYCGRNLTYERDKLPALSGIAHYLAKHTQDIYYAGLWKQHLWEDLYWRVGSPEPTQLLAEGGWCIIDRRDENGSSFACESEIGPFIPSMNRPRLPDAKTWVQGVSFPQANRAPSWSFASLDGQIAFEKIMVDRVVAQFIRCTVDLVGNDLFGEVRGGTLFLRAPVISVVVRGKARKRKSRTPTTVSKSLKAQNAAVPDGNPPIARRPKSEATRFVGYDPSERQILVELSTAEGVYKGTAVFDAGIKCPSLALFIDWEHALIIEPTAVMESSGSEDNFFRRTGIAKFPHPFEDKSAPAFLVTTEHIRNVAII